MQGDIEQRRYTTYGQATRRIIAERGVAALWSGLPFRLARQFIAVFLFDKINAELAPRLFPHAFVVEAKKPAVRQPVRVAAPVAEEEMEEATM